MWVTRGSARPALPHASASHKLNEHAAFSSGCGPHLVRMIHGARDRPIQKDATLQRFSGWWRRWQCQWRPIMAQMHSESDSESRTGVCTRAESGT